MLIAEGGLGDERPMRHLNPVAPAPVASVMVAAVPEAVEVEPVQPAPGAGLRPFVLPDRFAPRTTTGTVQAARTGDIRPFLPHEQRRPIGGSAGECGPGVAISRTREMSRRFVVPDSSQRSGPA